MTLYHRPQSLADALEALSSPPASGKDWVVVSGGTDVYPGWVGRSFSEPMLDVSALDELRGIRELPGRYEIGARTTWTDVLRADLPPLFDGLKRAASQVGGVQIQNVATVAGNVCNASPAADGVPPLLAMGAEVEIASARGVRVVPLDKFILGNRRTTLEHDELLTTIHIPSPGGFARSGFLKLGSRKYLVISIVMAAAVLETDGGGTVIHGSVAVGACSPVARRLPELEAQLPGRKLDGMLSEAVQPEHLSSLSPIDDIRGSASYRKHAALTLMKRLLEDLGGGP